MIILLYFIITIKIVICCYDHVLVNIALRSTCYRSDPTVHVHSVSQVVYLL